MHVCSTISETGSTHANPFTFKMADSYTYRYTHTKRALKANKKETKKCVHL